MRNRYRDSPIGFYILLLVLGLLTVWADYELALAGQPNAYWLWHNALGVI